MRGGSGARRSPRWRRAAGWAAVAGASALAGAGLGFIARDLLDLGQPAVALAWLAGAVLALAAEAERGRRRE